MSISPITPNETAEIAETLISVYSDFDSRWFDRVAPEHQQRIQVAKTAALEAYGESTNYERFKAYPIEKLCEEWLGLCMHAYFTSVRHGAAAEQFRVALAAD